MYARGSEPRGGTAPQPEGGSIIHSLSHEAPDVSVVIVAYGPEPWLERCVEAVQASVDVRAEVILVDNGGTEGRVERLEGRPFVRVVRPGRNVGFAEGCNLGVAASDAPNIALINPDAIVRAEALARLCEVANRPDVGIATASLRLADEPDRINSAGNDIHFLGVSWAGHFGVAASEVAVERAVTAASGGAMACRTSVWRSLGGFEERFFAYVEDADLSLRCWQRGLKVVYVPSAIVLHRYEFSRNATKMMLLERNRLAMVLTTFGPRHLRRIALPLVLFELLMSAHAAIGGWLPQKTEGYRWLLAHRAWLRQRRREVGAAMDVPERALGARFSAHLRPGNYPLSKVLVPFDLALAAFWSLARRTL